ncbi:MAG: hypothetical protein J7513_11795 [Solirubrobacteraceae bacterium]|nr:hypothetical protein [Solirubrobacteraceae bacterium]
MATSVFLPDLHRVGGLRWTQSTGGALTPAEERRLLGAAARGLATTLTARLWMRTGRIPDTAAHLTLTDFRPPDSAFAASVQEACAEQAPAWQAHSYRTWIFGRALAVVDGVDHDLDPELFYASALLHDHGIANVVPGEDFTLRSAERARRCAEHAGLPGDASTAVQDAITVHLTPGLTVARDGALGTYVQRGALLDLAGARAGDLPRALRRQAAAAHERGDVCKDEIPAVNAQCHATPRGRIAFARRCGLTLGMRWSPLRNDVA